MAAGGAAAAAIIAARQRRIQDVIDAFRVAGATAPDRARSLDELGVTNLDEANSLLESGALSSGRERGTYYLNEAAVIAIRESRKPVRAIAIVAAIVVLLIGLGFSFYAMGRAP